MPDAASYFGITPPGSPLSQFFPQPDDEIRAHLEGRPPQAPNTTGEFGPKEYQLAGLTSDPQGTLAMAQKIRGDIQSQRIIKGLSGLDFGSKDFSPSVAKLLSANSLGAQQSAVQNIIKLKALSGQQAKDSGYDLQAANAAKGLLSIPEDDPEYDSKFQKYINDLDPQVLTHPRLGSLIERGMHNSSVVRSKKSARETERLAVEKEARRAGIQPSKYDNLDDLNDAIADKMAESGRQKEFRDYLRTDKDTAKDYSSAQSRLRAPTAGAEWDAEKAAVMGKEIKDMTAEDWHQAHPLALQARVAKAREIADFIESQTGVNPMRKGIVPPETQIPPVPVAQAPTAPQVPTFSTSQEAEASNVPVGTVVIINGKKYKKT